MICNIDLIKIIVEIIGTFLIILIILNTLINTYIAAITIIITLFIAIYFSDSISNAHFNPVISFAFFMKNKLDFNLFIACILAQIFGAFLAIKFNNFIITKCL